MPTSGERRRRVTRAGGEAGGCASKLGGYLPSLRTEDFKIRLLFVNKDCLSFGPRIRTLGLFVNKECRNFGPGIHALDLLVNKDFNFYLKN